MEEIPGNAHRQKQERTTGGNKPPEEEREIRTKQVVEGEVVVRKRPMHKRVLDNFSSADGQSVGNFVWRDIIVPMTRDMLFDVINGGAQRAIFGNDVRRPPVGRGYGGAGYGAGPGVPYNARYSTPASGPAPSISARGRAMQNFNEVMVADRFKAEEVRTVLYELIDRYGYARVSDFYSAVGLSATHSDDKFGWDDLKGCKIRHVNGGYILDLPLPVEIIR